MVYFDYGATTPIRPEVRQEMEHFFAEQFANPHSIHEPGLKAKQAVEGARERIAAVIGAKPRQVVFTSGGTESNNLAIIGAARALAQRGKHLVTTGIEHKSVLGPISALEREGFYFNLVSVDRYGMIDREELLSKLTAETILVSLAQANNEIGTVQPISDFADSLKNRGILLHCDAVQSFGKIPLSVEKLGADLISWSGHKIYGPKGIGILYIGPGIRLEPLQYGGGQERGLRPGTLNVPAIMGLAKAVELAAVETARESFRLLQLRDQLLGMLLAVDGVYLNGHPTQRLPNHLNLGVRGIEGQLVVTELAKRGIAISAGSACGSGNREASHVLLALGQEPGKAREGFRVTLGFDSTLQDILYFRTKLAEVITDLKERFGYLYGNG